jgi:hypothetical protein
MVLPCLTLVPLFQLPEPPHRVCLTLGLLIRCFPADAMVQLEDGSTKVRHWKSQVPFRISNAY